MYSTDQVRKKYLDFFEAKGHTIIPSAPIIPENDPTTLFTGSGMQPLLPYLLGDMHPEGNRLVDSQKCFRAEDIEEVGDNRHTTFFEMLGNWSLGDYFKEEQLTWFFEFLTKEIKLDPDKLFVTVFSGDAKNNIPEDSDSIAIWKKLFKEAGISNEFIELGTEEVGAERGMKEGERIFSYNAKKNWWSRAGTPENMPHGEPGGPDSEVFYDFGTEHNVIFGSHCHPNCDCGRFMEIGNSVFMEYVKAANGTFSKLQQKNVDFGGGLERLTAAANDRADVFEIDALQNTILYFEKKSQISYAATENNKIAYRIIADHIRGAIFMIADGVLPSNTEQGYFVRRLVRRAIRYADSIHLKEGALSGAVAIIADTYKNQYPEILLNQNVITAALDAEESKFRSSLKRGLKQFEKLAEGDTISGLDAFVLFTTYGFPLELTSELAEERGANVDTKGFIAQMNKHKEQSRKGAEKKFKGGLADNGEKTTMLHTATHLMLAGLRKELGEGVEQRGSNTTAERIRFDFSHTEKVRREVLDAVELYVNKVIKMGVPVTIEKMKKDDARASGVVGAFWEKYPETVNVYTIRGSDGTVYSRELCGGPHVKNTKEIVGTFQITKEESSSAGVRRIKAILK